MSWYKMQRGWQDSSFFKEESYTERDAWSWIIGEARFEKSTVPSPSGKPINLNRGQLYSSIRFMAVKFKWSKDRVKRFLKRLEKWSMVTVETTTGQNLISVCNYNEYQGNKDTPKDAIEYTPKDGGKDTPKDKQEELEELKELKENIVDTAFQEFQSFAKQNGLSVPVKLTKTRESKLKARLNDCDGIDGWRMALSKLKQSSFCMGRKTNWKADFDFLLQEASFFKLMEGSYDDTNQNNKIPRQPDYKQQAIDWAYE